MSARRLLAAVEGAVVVAAMALVPVALLAALHAPLDPRMEPVARGLVSAGSLAWCAVVIRLSRLVASQLRGAAAASAQGPLAWAAIRIAALAIAIAPFLASSAGAAPAPAPIRSPAVATVVAVDSPPRATRLYTVVAGDSLWTIASQQLGDAERWTELASLNLGRTMTGGRTFEDPDLILPGWRLRLPTSTPDRTGAPPSASSSTSDAQLPRAGVHRPGAEASAERAGGSPTHLRRHGGQRRTPRSVPLPALIGTGAVLIALAAAARRRSRRRSRVLLNGERAVDLETVLLSHASFEPSLLTRAVRSLAAAGLLDRSRHLVVEHGEVTMDDGSWRYDPAAATVPAIVLVLLLGEHDGRTHVGVVPAGSQFSIAGPEAADLVRDAIRVAPSLDLGVPVAVLPEGLLRALALRDDGELVVCIGDPGSLDPSIVARCALITHTGSSPAVDCAGDVVVLDDGPCLLASALSPEVRELLDGAHDLAFGTAGGTGSRGSSGHGANPADARTVPNPAVVAAARRIQIPGDMVVVRLLTAVPRIDGLAVPLDQSRERRAIELLAYLALRGGEPVTGERLRMRVLGTADADAASKTLFNVASSLRRSLGDGPEGPRLPAAGRLGQYTVTADVTCDVVLLAEWLGRARASTDPDERLAWLRCALELIEGEPFATVLSGYDWFLAEGHLTRLQVLCEDAACELVSLALERDLVALATLAVERARLIEPSSEHLSMAAADIAEARLRATANGQWRTLEAQTRDARGSVVAEDAVGAGQASFEAIAPAARSTVPSAPVVT